MDRAHGSPPSSKPRHTRSTESYAQQEEPKDKANAGKMQGISVEPISPAEKQIPQPNLSAQDDILWTTSCLERSMNVQKSAPIKQLLTQAQEKLLDFQAKYASLDERPSHLVCIQDNNKTKLVTKESIVDWGKSPALLGSITPLVQIMHTPLEALEQRYAHETAVQQILNTPVCGIPLKHWAHYSELADKYDAHIKEHRRTHKKALMDFYSRKAESYAGFCENVLKIHEKAKKVDLDSGTNQYAKWPDSSENSSVPQKLKELPEPQKLDSDIIESLVEFDLKQMYDQLLVNQGWTLSAVIDDLQRLMDQALAEVDPVKTYYESSESDDFSDSDSDSGHHSGTGTESEDDSDDWL